MSDIPRRRIARRRDIAARLPPGSTLAMAASKWSRSTPFHTRPQAKLLPRRDYFRAVRNRLKVFLFCSYLTSCRSWDGMERSRDEPDEQGPSTAERLAELRARLDAERRPGAGGVLPLGVADLDARLPGGGLGLGLLHEVAPEGAGDEASALGFVLALVARHLARAAGDALLVVAPGHPIPYGHGLTGLGLDPGRLLLLEAEADASVFGALEETLRAGHLAAVAGLVADGLPLKPGRRLQLAAGSFRTAPPLLLILRPGRADLPNGAATRWRIAAGGAARDRFGCTLRPRWRARLDRCRNGRPGDWLLEWDHAAHRFDLPDGVARRAPDARGSRAG
ncbi:ImuA protein [Methylobacterium sp. E-016]|uniref:ImuA family protein n=1 Tax=Methylobacterium sp. E-016 TaxID=2836556 RepID=UPI001FBA7CE0|nr:ImuA protein [Methylobacterium sp. E-016]MCJ2079375.1 ImuA protein [Methylobacterium sp. E-016]